MEEEEARYREYLQKKAQIEELKRLRLIEIERNGLAMKLAQESEQERQRMELERMEKEARDNRAAKSRGNYALIKERQIAAELAS